MAGAIRQAAVARKPAASLQGYGLYNMRKEKILVRVETPACSGGAGCTDADPLWPEAGGAVALLQKVSAMHARRCQFLQQAVVSARRWIILSLPVLWLVTGVIFQFSLTWLWVVATIMSSVPFLVVLFLLTRQERHMRAFSRRLYQLERAMKQMHRGRHNNGGAP